MIPTFMHGKARRPPSYATLLHSHTEGAGVARGRVRAMVGSTEDGWSGLLRVGSTCGVWTAHRKPKQATSKISPLIASGARNSLDVTPRHAK